LVIGGDLDLTLTGGKTELDPDEGEKEKTDQTTIGLSGLCGYFVIRGLEVGGLLNIDRTTEETDDAKTTDLTWQIGPQVGYFYRVTDLISVYGLGAIGWSSSDTEVDPDAEGANNQTVEHSGWFIQPQGGAVFHLNNSIGISTSLFFQYYSGSGKQDDGNADTDGDVTRSEYGLKVGLLGFL
jgi:hypothetical protein